MRVLKLFTLFIVLLYSHSIVAQGYELDVERGEYWRHVINQYGQHWYGWQDEDGNWHWQDDPGTPWPPDIDYGDEGSYDDWGDNWWENDEDWWDDWWDDRDDEDWWDHWWDDPWDFWDWDTNETSGGNNIVNCPSIHTRTDKAPNRTRFLLGIGEELEVRIQNRCGANVQWSVTGSGGAALQITNSTNDFCTLQAKWKPGIVAVHATLSGLNPECASCNTQLQVWYNIIAPNDIYFDNTSTNPSCTASQAAHAMYVIHHYGYPSGGLNSDNYLLPETVNFYNVRVKEGTAPGVLNGLYWLPTDNPTAHPANNYISCSSMVYPGKGTKVSADDDIFYEFKCKNVRTPIDPGSASHTIPMYYRDEVTGGDIFMFNVIQSGENHGGPGNPNFTVSKKNASRSVKLLDPDFCPTIPANTCI